MNLEAMSLPITGAALVRAEAESEPALHELTEAIRQGDENAFTRFHRLYSLRLYKYLLVLAKGDDLEAREVLQAVVLKLATKMEVFNEERRLWAWMCRLARNAFLAASAAELRRSQRRLGAPRVPLDG